MKLSTLQRSLEQLPLSLVVEPKRLKDKLLNQYITKIYADFVGVIQSEAVNLDEKVQALKDLCAANWGRINRTCLSYTAIPSIAVTEFLTEVAQFVAEEENKKGCGVVRVVIAPKDVTDVYFAGFNSVCVRVREREDDSYCVLSSLDETSVSKKEALERIESSGLNSGYLRLNKKLYYANIEKNLFVQLAASASALKIFDEHVAGLSSLSSGSEASLFAKTLPNHPRVINGLYYGNQQHKTLARLTSTEPQLREFDETSPTAFSFDAIPAFSGDLAQAIEPMSALDVLMPGALIRTTPDSPNNNHFDTTLFYTHIQNEAGDELIPVRWLVEHRDCLTPEEYSRLTQHSDLTRAILASQQGYDAIASDTSTLLGQLNQLCRQLGVNSAQGRGEETNAAGGAYPAIIEFMTYYNALPATEVARIPAGVKAEIDLLLALTTDATQNVNATQNLATCIATRKSSLQTAMTGHDNTLNQIYIGGEHKDLLINTAKTNLESAKDDFIKALNEHNYTEGRDVLGLNTQLLQAFNTPFTIESLNDLNEFKTLTPAEIRDVLQSEPLKLQTIEQLRTLENWVILSMEMGPEQLSAWTQALSHELVTRFITNAHDFGALLISLDVEKCRIICSALNCEMPFLIKSGQDFGAVLRHLNSEQFKAVFELIQRQLPTLIKSALDFRGVLEHLNSEQCTAVFESMQSQLPALIQSGPYFRYVLESLNPEQRTVVFESMQSQLPALIQSGVDFMLVLEYLNPEQRTVVFESMQSQLPALIQSGRDLRFVLEYLNPEQRTFVLGSMQSQLPALIQSGLDFRDVLVCLNPEQRTVVLESMQSQLPALIKSGKDFIDVLVCLNPEQRTVVLESMQSQLPALIKSGKDFIDVLWYLKPEQRTVVLESMQSQLPALIQSRQDIGDVLRCLNPEQCKVVLESLQSQLPALIQSGIEFGVVLRSLSPEQRTVVLESMQSQLPALIQSGLDFELVLRYLSPEQCKAVLESMHSQLPALIQSGLDFELVLRDLKPEQRTVVFESMQSQLPALIQSPSSFRQIMGYLNLEERAQLYELMKTELLPNLVNLPRQFRYIMEHLTQNQRTEFYGSMKGVLPGIVKSYAFLEPMMNIPNYLAGLSGINRTRDGFFDLQSVLTSTQKAELFELMKDDLVNAVGSDRRLLSCFLKDAAANLGSLMLEAIDENLPAIIKSSADLVYFINILPIEKNIILLEFIAKKQPSLIESTHYVANVLHELSPEQCRLVCQSMRSLWPALIKSGQDFAEVLEHLNVEQRTAVYEVMTGEFPRLIQSGQDVGDVLQYLDPEQRTALYEGMKMELPRLIRTGLDYAAVIEHLDAAQRGAVYEAVKSRLPEIIKSGNDLFEFIAVIEPEHRSAVFELMRSELPTLIQTGEQLSNLMRLLPSEQRVELLTLMGSRLPNILRSAWDAGYLLLVLPEDQQSIVKGLPEFISGLTKLTNQQEVVMALALAVLAKDVAGIKQHINTLLEPEVKELAVKGRLLQLKEWIQPSVLSREQLMSSVDPMWRKHIEGAFAEGATARYKTKLSAERDAGSLGADSPRQK